MKHILMALVCMLVAACARQSPVLDTRYGSCHGSSINGVGVLVDLLRQQGHAVTCESIVFDGVLEDHDTVILVHDGFGALPTKTQEVLENFRKGPGRGARIVLLLRDFDAAIGYLETMEKRTEIRKDEETLERVQSMLNEVKDRFLSATSEDVDVSEGRWFGLRTVEPNEIRKEASLQDVVPGNFRYAGRKDSLDLRFRRRLELPKNGRPIWVSGDDVLLAEVVDNFGSVMVVANGSFLLNGAMVQSGNRKLAREFVERLGTGSRTVVLESSRFASGGDESPQSRLYTAWPNPFILIHLAALLGVYCWVRFPIFGRPIETTTSETRRFGRHVEALGDLLAASRLGKYADRRLQKHLRPTIKRSRSTSPNKGKS